MSIAAGELTGKASVGTVDDDAIEPDETFTVTLSNPIGQRRVGSCCVEREGHDHQRRYAAVAVVERVCWERGRG